MCAYLHDSSHTVVPSGNNWTHCSNSLVLSAEERGNCRSARGSSPAQGRGSTPVKCTLSAVTMKAAHIVGMDLEDLLPGGDEICVLKCSCMSMQMFPCKDDGSQILVLLDQRFWKCCMEYTKSILAHLFSYFSESVMHFLHILWHGWHSPSCLKHRQPFNHGSFCGQGKKKFNPNQMSLFNCVNKLLKCIVFFIFILKKGFDYRLKHPMTFMSNCNPSIQLFPFFQNI